MERLTGALRAACGWLRRLVERFITWMRSPGEPAPTAGDIPAVLRVAERVAFAVLWVVVTGATAAALAESYRALYEWAVRHLVPLGWPAMAWPWLVDTFVIGGEAALLIAYVRRLPWRTRAYFWVITALGLAASVGGNIGHVATNNPLARLTAAAPPVAAFAMLTVGLFVVKHVLGQRSRAAALDGAHEPAATRVLVDALVSAGITDTREIAAIVDRHESTVRRHVAAARADVDERADEPPPRGPGRRRAGAQPHLTRVPVPDGA